MVYRRFFCKHPERNERAMHAGKRRARLLPDGDQLLGHGVFFCDGGYPPRGFEASGEGLFVWEKIRPFSEDLRAAFKNPILLKNLETGAGKQIAFMEENAPGAYEAFQGRIRESKGAAHRSSGVRRMGNHPASSYAAGTPPWQEGCFMG